MQSPKNKPPTKKKGYTMKKCNKENPMDKKISDEQMNFEGSIKNQETIEDPLTELLRKGAQIVS